MCFFICTIIWESLNSLSSLPVLISFLGFQTNRVLPPSLNGAKDFVILHEQLYDEMKGRESDIDSLTKMVDHIVRSTSSLDQTEMKEMTGKSEEIKQRWDDVNLMIKTRLGIILPYADFHKAASKSSAEIDVLRKLSQVFNEDPSSELNASNFEQRLTLLHDLITSMQTKASEFFNTTSQVRNSKRFPFALRHLNNPNNRVKVRSRKAFVYGSYMATLLDKS